jgi:hypothetical protein
MLKRYAQHKAGWDDVLMNPPSAPGKLHLDTGLARRLKHLFQE